MAAPDRKTSLLTKASSKRGDRENISTFTFPLFLKRAFALTKVNISFLSIRKMVEERFFPVSSKGVVD